MDLWLDTNVIIRFLANDHVEHGKAAKKLFESAYQGKHTLWVNQLVAAECCYVLESSYYGYPRKTIADHLIKLLNSKGIKPESQTLLKALELYSLHNIDFEDAYLSCLALENPSRGIISFNKKDFARCGCECYDPTHLDIIE